MRYPFDPIDRLFPFRSDGQPNDPLGLAALIGASNSELSRWRREGMTTERADLVAVTLGYHPALLWPTWFEDAEEEGRCPWCGEWRFDGKYCNAREREWMKQERARDRLRAQRWWERIERYRETVVMEEVA